MGKKKYIQFFKLLMIAFMIFMLPLSTYVIVKCLSLAELAISNGFMGALPYVTAIVGFVEATIIAVIGFYSDNSKKEKIANAQYGCGQQNDQRKDI